MALELQKRFGVAVANRLVTNSRDALWKHRVHAARPRFLDGGTLAVLMVKEPHFWIQSTARNFYELHPVVRDERGGLQDTTSRELADLFDCVEHDKTVYPDAVALWTAAVRSYFDDEVFPASAAVVVRAEDFLFRFDAVMDELAATWAFAPPESAGAEPPEPREKATKSGARSRSQALAYYADPANRDRGFSGAQLGRVSEGADPALAAILGYGEGAVAGWAA
uniref:Uncharacterized protein n=1 Tax=Alexandrium catenella TaxID=2925 RepID=A0A7S1S6H0_ALECA